MTITPSRQTVPSDEKANRKPPAGIRGVAAKVRQPLLCRTADGVLSFYAEHGRLPAAPEGGEYLALRELRNKARAGELSPQDMTTLKSVPRALEGRLSPLERYAEIKRWCEENSRMPQRIVDPANEQERVESLMAGQTNHFLYDGSSPESEDRQTIKTGLRALRAEYGTKPVRAPGTKTRARSSGEKYFTEMAAQVQAYMDETGRRPRRHEEHEGLLGDWMWRTRRSMARGTLSGPRVQLFAPLLATWESLPSNVSARGLGEVHDCIQIVGTFYRVNARLPGFSADPQEYRALRLLRKQGKNGALNDTEMQLIAEIPGALERVRLDPLERLEELRQWCAANSRTPRHTIRKGSALTREEEAEQSLGQWMYRHVNRRHKDARETETTMHVRNTILELKSVYPGIAGMTPRSRKAPAAGVAA